MTVSKASVAESQLGTAIMLWFSYGDPISILTLATAANDCYDALGAHAGTPSPFKDWLKSQSKGFQDRARYAQNFVKHGRKHLSKKAYYAPVIGEVLIFDSIECHWNLVHRKTHLMTLFIARWMIENPSEANAALAPTILKLAKVDDLADRDRTKFFEKGLERLSAGG